MLTGSIKMGLIFREKYPSDPEIDLPEFPNKVANFLNSPDTGNVINLLILPDIVL